MYHYSECGLSNIYLKNGFSIDNVDGEEYTTIEDINGLHCTIAQIIVEQERPLTNEEFKFLRMELNMSQKLLGKKLGVSEQTIARYEKKQSDVPRTTDVALRALYMESQNKSNPVSYFLDLLCDAEAAAAADLLLEEVQQKWLVAQQEVIR